MTVLFVLLITAAAVACIARGECAAGPCNNPQRRPPSSTLVVGLLIVLIGTVLLLDRMGVMDASRVFRFWPVLLIIFGLVGVFRADEPGKLVARGLIGLAGVLLLLMELQVVHFGFHEVWPVFIIVAGLLLVWAATLFISFGLARALAGAAPVVQAISHAPQPGIVDEMQRGYRFVRGSPIMQWVSYSAILFSVCFFSLALPFSRGATAQFPDADQLAGFHAPIAPTCQERVLKRRSSESPIRCLNVSATCWSKPIG